MTNYPPGVTNLNFDHLQGFAPEPDRDGQEQYDELMWEIDREREMIDEGLADAERTNRASREEV